MVFFILSNLLLEELGSVAIDSAHLVVSPCVGIPNFLAGGIGAEVEEFSPNSGAGVGVPGFDRDAGGSVVDTYFDRRGESHVVGVYAGAKTGERKASLIDGGTSNEDAGITALRVGGVGVKRPAVRKRGCLRRKEAEVKQGCDDEENGGF